MAWTWQLTSTTATKARTLPTTVLPGRHDLLTVLSSIIGGHVSAPAVMWGGLCGIGQAFGVWWFYAALGAGPISVVSPVNGAAGLDTSTTRRAATLRDAKPPTKSLTP